MFSGRAAGAGRRRPLCRFKCEREALTSLCRRRRSYNGAYYQGMRQGTGIYTFSGKNEADLRRHRGSGVYIGEWLKGMMHG